MKKYIEVIIIAGLLTGIFVMGGLAWIYVTPKQIDIDLDGVSYQIGVDWEEAVTISIKGELKRKFRNGKTFFGTFDISEEDIPISKRYRRATIHLSKNNFGVLSYHTTNKYNQLETYIFGTLLINKDFSEVTIMKRNELTNNWSGSDGLMITAPAADRVAALELSRSLSKDDTYIKTFSNELERVKSNQ